MSRSISVKRADIGVRSAGSLPAIATPFTRVPRIFQTLSNLCTRALPFFLITNLWAAHGIVQTTDGKSFEGDIRIKHGAFVVGGTNAEVELPKLALMRIQPPSLTQTQGLRGTYFSNQNF